MTPQIDTPQIRFEGFTEPWEQRKLGDLSNLLTGFPFESKQFVERGVKLLRGVNVKRGFVDFSEDNTVYWKTVDQHDDYLLNPDDIVIQMDGALIGQSYGLVEKKHLPALLVQRVTRIRTNQEQVTSAFILPQIQKDFRKYINVNKTETSIPHLSLKDIANFVISISNIDEERKVGRLFSELDSIITLHQRKLDTLKVVKKSLLGKMFPKKGEVYPEIRFEGFTEPWQQRKLGEIASVVGGGTPDTNVPQYWNGDIDWYSPVEIGDRRYVSHSVRQITEDGLSHSSATMLPANKTILFTSRAGIGNTAILLKDACTNQGFQSLVVNANADVDFVYSLSSDIKKQAEQKAAGSTFLEISGKQLAELQFAFPAVAEQKKIGSFFKRLDAVITLHQRNLDNLKKVKKSLLGGMFPSGKNDN